MGSPDPSHPLRPRRFHGGGCAAREFFIQNETIILFAQGLVFFSLGFAVWLQRRRATRLTLSSSLIWLAAFAFVEALAVWGYVFVPIQETYLDVGVVEGLQVLRAIVQVAAFVFLVQFGLRLIDLPAVARRSLTGLSIVMALGILGGTALAASSTGWGVAEWEEAANALARYGLLFPGAVLSAVGLWRQRAELGDAGMTAIKPYAAAAAAVLAIYGILGGLVVPPGPISPGGVGDADGWFDLTGLPLEVMRGIAGLVLCVLAVKLLEIFDVEAKQQLEALDRARAIAEERARFRRDLHDGTIQSIYAAGLHLEAIAIRSGDPAVRTEVREVVGDLNAATDGIRDYIRALAQPPATPQGIAATLGDLTRRFTEETGREVRFTVEGVATSGPLPEEAGQHLGQILREALTNTARHAGVCRVRVSLLFASDELDLVVDDDGRGPSQPRRRGRSRPPRGAAQHDRARPSPGRPPLRRGGSRRRYARHARRAARQRRARDRTLHVRTRPRGVPLVTTAPTDPITVLIVDDHTVVRIGLRTLLSNSAGFRVVGEAQTAAEAVQLNEQTRPDVVLMDVRLPDGSGVEACRRIKADHPDARVLMLTSYSDEEAIVGAVMAGASGYLLKQADAERLTQAIREAAAGQSTLDPRAAGALLTQFRELSAKQAEAELAGLTDRERRMLALIAEGYTNRAIGEVLHLSEKTVRNHVSQLLRKLGFQRRSQAAAWAGQRRLELPPD